MAAQTTRRALFGGAGLAGVTLALPAVAALATSVSRSPSEFARLRSRSDAARARFNTLPEALEHSDPALFAQEERLMHDATDAFDRAAPTDLFELVVAMENLIGSGGYPGPEICDQLIGHARRLAGGRA